MTVDDGSRVTSDGASIGGFAPASFNGNAGATGTVTVNGGSSVWDAARDVNGNVDAGSQLFIDNPTSTIGLAILQRGQVISGAGFIGDFSTHSINSVVVDSVGSQWTNLTSLSVGYSQTGFGSNVASAGFLDITRGGRVSAPTINVGVLPDGGNGGVVDSIVVSQGSHLQASGTLTVGLFGTANLTVDTAAVTSGSGIIGFSSATPGNLTQTGVGLLDTQGVGANSVGTVLVTGAGANWTTGSLIVGDNATTDTSGTFTGIGGGTATGILTVADGGAINSTTAIQVALNAGSTGTINIGAADGQAAAAPGTISAPAIVFGAGTGTLVFNHTSTNYVFDASIQGAGSVIVDAGTTALTAVNSYTGATTINGGVLEVDGSLTGTSSVTVNAGGILTGSGTIDPPLVAINNGGSLLGGNGVPGSSTKIVGNLVFQSGASYMVGLDPTTSSLASVTGTATLGGATAEAFFANGSYIQKRYTILTATGGVSGSFGSLTNINLPTNLTDSLSYDANDVFLDLSAVLGSTGGLNGNQQNVANAINSFFNGGGAMPPAFASLFALSGDNLAAGLTQLSGETAIGSQQTTFDAMNLFLGLITDPFITGRGDGISSGGGPTGYTDETLAYAAKHTSNNAPAAIYGKAPPLATFEQRWSVWAAGFGGSQTTDGNTVVGSNSTTSRIAATAVGADYRFSPDTLAGLALAGGGTSFSVANGGTGRSDLFQAGAFVRHNAGPAYITAALAYGWQDVTTNRTVTIAGLDQLQARFNANAYSGRVEGGYRFVAPWTGGIGITPYAAGQFTTFDLPAYAENAVVGTNAFALAYGAKTVTDPRSELGIRTDKSYAMSNGILILRGRFAWAHDYDPDRAIGATFQTLPGASFVVNGAAQAHDSALTTASAEMKWMNGWSAAATFEGEFSNVTASYAGKGVLRYQW
jgi:autotransporter-associated beta strand protein/T5SS/PEP-CTERM-associated repeat protein